MNNLKYRDPTSHTTVDDFILGGSGVGSLFSYVSDEQARETILTAINQGITQIDTAPLYGLGHSEVLIGKVLREVAKPQQLKLYTKIGRLIRKRSDLTPEQLEESDQSSASSFHSVTSSSHVPIFDYSREATVRSFNESLERLGGYPITCLRIHDAETDERFSSLLGPEGAVEGLIELKNKGLIKQISAGLNDPNYLIRLAEAFPAGTFDNFMCAGNWNLLDCSGYELFQLCQQKNIRISNAAIFASGLLWGGSTYRYQPAPQEMVQKAERWKTLAEKYGLPLPAVAFKFAMLPTVVESVAVGCRSPQEIEDNVKMLGYTVPNSLWHDAQAQGLLPDFVTLP